MRFLPIFLDLAAAKIALVGAGDAARNKLRLLLAAGADVRWYAGDGPAPGPGPGVRLELSRADPLQANFLEFALVISAVGGPLDDAIAALARAHHIPVNVVDRLDLSSFIFPAIVDRGEVVVAIGTGGASPVLARRLRERIEAMLPARIGELAALLHRHRDRLAGAGVQLARRFWEQVIDGPIAALALAGHKGRAEAALARDIENRGRRAARSGIVHLVGAGPGDPDHLTLRALQVLQDADIVFHDELVTPDILDRVRRDAERVLVGKRRGVPGVGQDEINRRLAEAARAGRNVVRLKGGDPFVFGRGGEELEYLRQAGIEVIVVPGITAALGCAAAAGLPLTFRDEATRLTLVTAHRVDDAQAIDWTGLAHATTTIAVYMGGSAAPAVRDGLIAAGRDPETPVAVVARGTRPDAESRTGRLAELAALAAETGEGPTLLVIGDVVARSDLWRTALLERASLELAA